jgi:hypothetical protein
LPAPRTASRGWRWSSACLKVAIARTAVERPSHAVPTAVATRASYGARFSSASGHGPANPPAPPADALDRERNIVPVELVAGESLPALGATGPRVVRSAHISDRPLQGTRIKRCGEVTGSEE